METVHLFYVILNADIHREYYTVSEVGEQHYVTSLTFMRTCIWWKR
jgi:hypothetical protein